MPTVSSLSHADGLPPRWGKTRRDDKTEGAPFHRLIHHMLDVASVLEVLLDRRPDLLRQVADGLRLAPEAMRRLLLALTALHDLGKVATGFQAQAPGVCASLGLAVPDHVRGRYSRGTGHDLIGQAMLCELRPRLPPALARLGRQYLPELAAIVAGHHGRVPPADDLQWSRFTAAQVALDSDLGAALAYVEAVLRLYAPDPDPPDPTGLRRFSYLLNGIVTVCDWLGSHEAFALVADEVPLEAYRQRSLRTAGEVVQELRPALFWRPVPGRVRSFANLFAHLAEDGAPLRPTWLQAAVATLFRADHLPDGPLLLLIEDVAGSGKTEAGDLAAQRLIALGRTHGLYAALPTTATADAAFLRKRLVVERFYGAGMQPQISLAHSRAGSREMLTRYRTRAELEIGDPGCLDWTSRSTKRALLADVGVGTVDQALLGALRARHATVRLAGLHGKLLLVDEVHAYDDYMQAPLQRLLHHQASLGQHVVLMSATLPSRIRDNLLAAFANGAGWPPDHPARALPKDDRFPALHLIHAGGVLHRGPKRPPLRRPCPVRFEAVQDEESVIRRIAVLAEADACVLWVRNTVREAVSAFDRLRLRLGGAGDRILLYHARFLPRDRQAAETRLLAAIGKESTPATRRGRVIVATQAAEQSLDLDADELVTDLAPVDSILQRLGRRRRHLRNVDGTRLNIGTDGRVETPVLLHMPPPEAADRYWIERFSPGTARIYEDHGRLWLGAALLLDPRHLTGRSCGTIDPWVDGKSLVEAVYAEDDTIRHHLPSTLRGRTDAASGIASAERGQGDRVALAFKHGLLRDWNVVDASRPEDEVIATTRLGESYEHLLAIEDGGLAFLVDQGDPLEASAVRYWRRIEGLAENDHRRLRLLEGLDRRMRQRAERSDILAMRPDGEGAWQASGRIGNREVEVRYDRLRGLFVGR